MNSIPIQLIPSASQPYFIKRFVNEMTEHDDVIFVDACETGGSHRFTSAGDRHWNFPLVKQVIDDRFELIDTLNGALIYQSRRK